MRTSASAVLLLLTVPAWAATAAQNEAHEAGHPAEDRVPVEIAPAQQARMGIKTVRATMEPLSYDVRAPGVLKTDEGKETHFHTRVSGWIEEIHVDSIGKTVRKGEPLFDLYSPDLVTTQSEYVAALAIGEPGREVAEAALTRLRYFGVPEREIRLITKRRAPKRTITFESPISGYVVEKNAIRGLYVTPDVHLYHLADLARLWVLATLYEADLRIVGVGDRADVVLTYDPSHRHPGRVSFIYPDVDPQTRTGTARIEVDNPQGALKPGMYATVELSKSLGTQLTIPEDSVIDTGQRKLVFVRTSAAAFEPREIQTGPRVGRRFVVVAGVSAGEELVTGANFLLDAESKLRAAIDRGDAVGAGHGGAGHGAPPKQP